MLVPITDFLVCGDTLLEITEPHTASLTQAWLERYGQRPSFAADGDAVRGYHAATAGSRSITIIRAANQAALANALSLLRQKWHTPLIALANRHEEGEAPRGWPLVLSRRVYDPSAVHVWQASDNARHATR